MRRREFITLLGGVAAAAWPLAARAQQGERMRRIGVLMAGAKDEEGQARFAAFHEGLKKLGWVDGRNLHMDQRWGGADRERVRAYAAELVSLKPDVIMVNGIRGLGVLRQETSTIPIVFVGLSDPVGTGFVASLARPGGNITGFTIFELSLVGKWMDTLKEVAPAITRVALLHHPDNVNSALYRRSLETVAPSFRVTPAAVPIRDTGEIERTIDAFGREPNGGLVIPPDLFLSFHRELIAGSAARHRLPAVYPYRAFVASGGLMSYGVEQDDLHRRAAAYVDRILRGERPTDLPVQAPTKFELVIKLKTAKVLGLNVPPTLLARADEVIE